MNDRAHGPMDPIAMARAAAAAAAKAQAPQAIDPMQAFAQFFGLSVPALQALKANLVPCMCGKCQGVGIQAEARLHFLRTGQAEIITRGDAVAPPAPEAAPVEAES